jgi:hypothetical protein
MVEYPVELSARDPPGMQNACLGRMGGIAVVLVPLIKDAKLPRAGSDPIGKAGCRIQRCVARNTHDGVGRPVAVADARAADCVVGHITALIRLRALAQQKSTCSYQSIHLYLQGLNHQGPVETSFRSPGSSDSLCEVLTAPLVSTYLG